VTQPIDRAFVDIEARTQDFSRDLNRDVEKAYAGVEKQTELVQRKITSSFDKAGREIKRTFEFAAKNGKVSARIIEDAFDDAGDKIRRSFNVAAADIVDAEELIAVSAEIAAHSVGDSFEHAGDRIERAFHAARRNASRDFAEIAVEAEIAEKLVDKKFNNPISQIFSKLLQGASSLGESLLELGAEINPGSVLKFAAIVGGLIALTGPVIALGAALAELAGLVGPIPAIFGTLLAVILPLVLAFQGLGAAIKAVNEGDPEKIAKAMKNLAPAARSVVKEITGLNSVFTRFRKNIQQSFFAPIVGDLGETVRKLLPGLQRSINQTAHALGLLVENFLALFDQDRTLKILNSLFTTTASIINDLNVPLVNFVNTLLELVNAGLPFVKRFASAFDNLLTRFNNFVAASIKTGKFNDFVENALRVLGELKDLLVSVGRLLGAIFGNAKDEGEDFIKTLTGVVDGLTSFFKSAKGQKVLQDLLDNIKVIMETLGFLIAVFETSAATVDTFIDAVKGISKGIAIAVQAIGSFFVSVGKFVADVFGKVVDFFKSIPGKVMDALKLLPGLIIGFFKFIGDSILQQIGIGIGLIIFTFTKLPGMIIDAVKALPGLLGNFFVGLWDKAKSITKSGIDFIVGFVKSLPGRIISLATSVASAIGNFFIRVFNGGKANAKSAIDAIIGFVRNLPSRLTSFVKDIGGDIAGVIKSLLNHAIDKINEGIKKVDDVLPGDLPRIPRLAKGGVVQPRPGGTIAQIAEAGKPEVVSPLDTLKKMIAENAGPSVTFGPGAVQVTFEGVVPTESQARQTGNAVGLGIADILAKRNIRTLVRAV
jgi:phage-related protein